MNPSDADWWWTIGLDGIVGAVVTGAIAAAAVWATIRHERRESAKAELRALVWQGRSASTRASLFLSRMIRQQRETDEWLQVHLDVWNAASSVAKSAVTTEPELAADMEELATRWLDSATDDEALQVDEVHVLLAYLGSYTSTWLESPKKYRSAPRLTPDNRDLSSAAMRSLWDDETPIPPR